MAVSLVSANLANACMESFLYGIFFLLFCTSTYFLLRRQQRLDGHGLGIRALRWRHFQSPMLLAGILIYLGVTAHWTITVTRLFDAFVNYEGGTDPSFFFVDVSQPTNVTKTAIFITTLLTSDAMIIYRLFIIWNYDKRVILLPCLTWCGLGVSGYGTTYHFTKYTPGETLFEVSIGRWITCDAVFTLVTNVYCTAFIAWRVWRSRMLTTPIGAANLMNVLSTLVESAALYSSWNLFFLISYEVGSDIQYTALDTWNCIAGIAYMLINVRVSLGWAQTADSHARRETVGELSTFRPTSIFQTTQGQVQTQMQTQTQGQIHPFTMGMPLTLDISHQGATWSESNEESPRSPPAYYSLEKKCSCTIPLDPNGHHGSPV